MRITRLSQHCARHNNSLKLLPRSGQAAANQMNDVRVSIISFGKGSIYMDKKRIFMKKKDWISRIDAVKAAFQRELGPLAPENLNLKPNSQSWCIAQVLQHLILVNSSYFPVIVALKEKKYAFRRSPVP